MPTVAAAASTFDDVLISLGFPDLRFIQLATYAILFESPCGLICVVDHHLSPRNQRRGMLTVVTCVIMGESG